MSRYAPKNYTQNPDGFEEMFPPDFLPFPDKPKEPPDDAFEDYYDTDDV